MRVCEIFYLIKLSDHEKQRYQHRNVWHSIRQIQPFNTVCFFCDKRILSICCTAFRCTQCPMQLINELSIEYDFIGPNYEITSTYFNNIPTFVANCTVIKDCTNYTCTSERSTNKKQAKHNAARKLLDFLNKKYVFSNQNGLGSSPKKL